ncbi:uncharacterized protein EV422DRAFT_530141, partial [Fimicolochytrium jonesii]|uniref:uncharacterized protein n=1 Tax=Fimicolochytrium jonesii TaxID=1396493 RepID=UPI0022FE5C4F
MDNATMADPGALLYTQSNLDEAVKEATQLALSNVGLTIYMSNQIVCFALHAYLLAILGDRILLLKDRATLYVFFAAVAANFLAAFWQYIANTGTWLDEYGEHGYEANVVYYTVRSALAALKTQTVLYLNYRRVEQAASLFLPRWVSRTFRVAVFLQFPITLANELIPTIEYAMRQDNYDSWYNFGLVTLDWAYGMVIDCLIGAFTFQSLYRIASRSKSGRREHIYFVLAHCFRVGLFVAYDIISAFASLVTDFEDSSLRTTALWAIRVIPVKPYLLITDMARWRAMSSTGEDQEENSGGVHEGHSTKVGPKKDHVPKASTVDSAALEDGELSLEED